MFWNNETKLCWYLPLKLGKKLFFPKYDFHEIHLKVMARLNNWKYIFQNTLCHKNNLSRNIIRSSQTALNSVRNKSDVYRRRVKAPLIYLLNGKCGGNQDFVTAQKLRAEHEIFARQHHGAKGADTNKTSRYKVSRYSKCDSVSKYGSGSVIGWLSKFRPITELNCVLRSRSVLSDYYYGP